MAEKLYEAIDEWAGVPAGSQFTFNSENTSDKLRESHAHALRYGRVRLITAEPAAIIKAKRMSESLAWEQAQEDGLK